MTRYQARVLVVSNDSALIANLKSLLEHDEYRPIVVRSFPDAQTKSILDNIDLVIVDGSLPYSCASVFCSSLHSADGHPGIPLLAVVDKGEETDKDSVINLVDDWLAKPIRPVELFRRLRSALENRALVERIRDLELVKESALALSSSLDLDQIMALLIKQAEEIGGFKKAVIFLLDNAENLLVARAASFAADAIGLKRLDGLRLSSEKPEVKGLFDARALVRLRLRDVPDFYHPIAPSTEDPDSPVFALPLMVEEKRLGLMLMTDPGSRHGPNDQACEFISLLSGPACRAINNALHYEEAKRREMEATFLLEATAGLDPSQGLPNVLQNLVDEAVGVVGEWCAIFIVDGKTGDLTPVASSQSQRRWPQSDNGGLLEGFPNIARILLDALSDGRPRFERFGVDGGRRAPADSQEYDGIRSLLAVPIADNSRILGILAAMTFQGSDYELSERDHRLAHALAQRAAIGLVNLRLLEIVATGKREWEETFDAIADGIFITDTHCKVMRANKAFASLLGIHPRDVVGKMCFEVLWHSAGPCSNCPHSAATEPDTQAATKRNIDLAAGDRELQLTTYPMLDSLGKPTASVHILKDVTERNRLQEMIIQSEKLRAIGELASGVAHDFNNLLASIVGWSEMAMASDPPDNLLPSISAINQAAMDGAEAVKRIQEYTRISKETEFAIVDVSEVTRGAVELSRPRWKDWAERNGISINLSVELANVAPVLGNASDLREVLVNIVFNAVDAVGAGGEIRIETGMEDDKVLVKVSDSGTGMTEEVRRRVFDPFFTTKGSAGSGLGLSVAYGIIARHGGEIAVESRVGKGSRFTVLLPAVELDWPDKPMEEDHTSETARILVIDDDERVLKVLESMLLAQGHVVTCCPGGEQGIAAFGKEPFDVVITDLGMPGLNGYEVASAVKKMAPLTPVVLLTGWGREIAHSQFSSLGIDAVIPKPCRIGVLANTIRDALRSHSNLKEIEGPVGKTEDGAADSGLATGFLRVLIVEDNKWFGEALRQRLEVEGLSATLTSMGHEALELLQDEQFDLLMCDLCLGDMSGLEVVRSVANSPVRPFSVMMSGHIVGGKKPLQEVGVDAILPKPWKDEELGKLLNLAVEKRRASPKRSSFLPNP